MANGLIHNAVPHQVLEEIKKHVREKSYGSERAWRSASKSEDTITGHWGGQIMMDWSEPMIVDGYSWRFRVDYSKFSSSTEEQPTGSDGIFQIEVERFDVAVTPIDESRVQPEIIERVDAFMKGILFQSKKVDNTKRKEMVKQLKDIEKLTPGEGAFFEYGPDLFRAATAKSVIASKGFTSNMNDSEFARLGDFLADDFLDCRQGVEGMYFDFNNNVLYFPKENEGIRRIQRQMQHGFRVQVKAFRLVEFNTRYKRFA